jgi:hypothetical protein
MKLVRLELARTSLVGEIVDPVEQIGPFAGDQHE